MYILIISMLELWRRQSYDELAMECKKLLEEDSDADLDKLFMFGGSSGGARPKIHIKINGEDWIIKFPATYDNKDIGLQEYEYSLCAKECGITCIRFDLQ